MLREQVRRFAEREVVPHGEKWERDGKIPREIFRRMGALGFLGMRHPVEYGGTAMGPLASLVFAEELGRSTFGGFSSSTLVHSDMSAIHITLRGTAKRGAERPVIDAQIESPGVRVEELISSGSGTREEKPAGQVWPLPVRASSGATCGSAGPA